MDEGDRGQAAADMHFKAALAARRRTDDRPAREDCIDCGAPIPAARRAAVSGCERCVFCQERWERDGC